MFHGYGIAVIFCVVTLINLGHSARILAICPRAAVSHQAVLRGFALALNKRGHELVVVTTDPMNDQTLKNYTEIDISDLYESNRFIQDTSSFLNLFYNIFVDMLNEQTDRILDNADLRKLYAPNSNEKFDLIILELMYWPGLHPLGKRFDAPIVGFSPFGLTTNVQYAFGIPILASHPSNWDLYTTPGPFSFYERVINFMNVCKYLHYYYTVYTPQQQAIARKYFGNDVPDISQLEKNISLVFVNQQAPISHVKPSVPKIVGISGFHMSTEIKPLPKNLQIILDEATQGFVYMSLGSNMKSSMLSKELLNELITAFSKLPFKVLWKFESDVLPNKPDNVHIMKWIPQRAVLAHPNLKVFVYQGGLQSTEEAVSAAVPLIGLPTWADQLMQVDKMVSVGVAKKLDISKLDRNNLEKAILDVTLENSYKENMLRLRTLMHDNSQDLLESAIWWTEHVIRNKGAPHLHSSTADEPWYKRQDMDVIAFISAASITILYLILFILYKLLINIINLFSARLDSKKQKVF